MTTEVVYWQRLYIPLNIRYPVLFKDCEDNGVIVEKSDFTRVFDFFAPSEKQIRYIRTKYILKEYDENSKNKQNKSK